MLIYVTLCTLMQLRPILQDIHSSYRKNKIYFVARTGIKWTGQRSRYSDWLRAGRFGIESQWGRDFPPVQTGLGDHPASCTMGTGSFLGIKSGRGVTLTPQPLLVPWWGKSRAILLLPLWVVGPVQSLSACKRVHFTYRPTFNWYQDTSCHFTAATSPSAVNTVVLRPCIDRLNSFNL